MNNGTTLNNIHVNVGATFYPQENIPDSDHSAYVHPLGFVNGNVHLGKRVMVGRYASIRSNEGQRIWVSDDVNIQESVVLDVLEPQEYEYLFHETAVEVGGKFYDIHIGARVSLAHKCEIHGPASIGYGTFVGMQVLVLWSKIGKNCVIEPEALVMGVTIADGRYVPAGALITTQAVADNLPYVSRKVF